jgi:flagellar biosynthesis/type III secretory pathway protein FliH
MLSYKQYKQLNESLYGAVNLGIKSPSSLTPPIGATGATEVVELEKNEDPSLEEAKKCGKMMKKGMEDEKCEDEDDVEEKDEDEEEEESEEEKDSDDEEDEEKDSDKKGLTAAQKKGLPEGLRKAIEKKKKAGKKEWSEILADFDSLLEGKDQTVVDQIKNSLEGIKKLLETREMTEEEKAWWASVNNQLGPNPGECGFAPVGQITQAIR